MITIRSRIKEFISDIVMDELYKVCKKRSISDNNKKVRMIEEILTAHKVDYVMLGPGTNRVAFLIDNYVFKIAMDDWGIQDNRNEYTNSYELQPYVIKTYETNGLISVCEYVTLITREEFQDNAEGIIGILSTLGDSYLLGDVGYAPKNFTNWGYRDSGDLVILDFAYIYQISSDIIMCSKDRQILEYNQNFTAMQCPRCHAKYTFMDLRMRIPKEYERALNEEDIQNAYALTTPRILVDEDDDSSMEEIQITRNDVLRTNVSEQPGKVEEERNEEIMHDEREEAEDGMDAYRRFMERLSENKGNPQSFVEVDEELEDTAVYEEEYNDDQDIEDNTSDKEIEEQDIESYTSVEQIEEVDEALNVAVETAMEPFPLPVEEPVNVLEELDDEDLIQSAMGHLTESDEETTETPVDTIIKSNNHNRREWTL